MNYPDTPIPADTDTPSTPRARLSATVASHSATDFLAFVSVSLMPLLATHLSLSNQQVAILLGLGSVTSGLIQPIVAWLSDRFDSRIPAVAGLALAVLCVSFIGFAPDFQTLLLLHGLGALGIGAFHPPSAACAGQLSQQRRSLGLATFFIAGMLGGVAGNILAPLYVQAVAGADADTTRGLHALVWLLIPGTAAIVLLAWAIHSVPHRHADAHHHHHSLSPAQRKQRWTAVAILYIGNVIKFTSNMALIYLFQAWARQRILDANQLETLTDQLSVKASIINGPLQGAMQVGMGGAGLIAGALLAERHEKLALVTMPMLGAIAIALFPHINHAPDPLIYPLAIALSILSGAGFGSLIPLTMSLAQRLLPHRTSLASGLMLGGAWTFAFIGPISAERIQHIYESTHPGQGLQAAFYAVAAFLTLAGLVSLALPSVIHTAETPED